MSTATVIDLNQYELGTIFQYAPAKDWCRDGKAVIIEAFDRRYLVDTYWQDTEGVLRPEEAAAAVVIFVPSAHRKISRGDAEVYGDDKVIRITRQHGSYTTLYVTAETPPLTELDHCRHMLSTELDAHDEAVRKAESSARTIERYRKHIATLEAAQ